MTEKPVIAGIVLAAGRSTRMGDTNKLLADFNGQPMVERVLAQVEATGIKQICVVTGHEADKVEEALAGHDVRFVRNDKYRDGLSTSLIAGIEVLGDEVDGAVVVLGDMPLVRGADIRLLIQAFNNRGNICVPLSQGRRGNPVLWGGDYFAQLQKLSGDKGARDLLKQYCERVIEVEMAGEGVLRDFDTVDDLASGSGKTKSVPETGSWRGLRGRR